MEGKHFDGEAIKPTGKALSGIQKTWLKSTGCINGSACSTTADSYRRGFQSSGTIFLNIHYATANIEPYNVPYGLGYDLTAPFLDKSL